MQDISNEILIQASLGSASAFEQIYKAASGFIYTIAFRITNSRETAEDVTQEVFLKIHKHLKDFKFRSSFKTWAYRITVNTAISISKRASKEMNYYGLTPVVSLSQYKLRLSRIFRSLHFDIFSDRRLINTNC